MINEQQHEGFAYLGLGLIVIVVISIIIFIYHLATKKISKKYLFVLPLFGLCFLMLIFAITNTVSINTEVLFSYPTLGIIKKVGNIFRAVGRFSWPFYYLMIIMSIIIVSKARIKSIAITTVLLFLTILQIYDIENLITSRDLKSGTFVSKLDEKKWKLIIDNFDEIITYPAYSNNMVYKMDYQDLMYVALQSKKPISIGYVARENVTGGRAFNDTILNQIKRGEIEKNRVYVTNAENIKDFNVLIYKDKVNIKRLDKFIFLYSKENKLKKEYKEQEENIKYVDSLKNRYKVTSKYIVFNGQWESVDSMKFNLEDFSNSEDVIKATGWAHLKNVKNNSKDTIFIGLSGKSNTYLFPTEIVKRGDVTSAAKAENLDNSGFKLDIFTDKLPKDKYIISLVIKDKNGKYHKGAVDRISEPGKKTYKTPILLKEKPENSNEIIFNVENVELKNDILKLNGWAAIKDNDSRKSQIKIVLIKNNKYYAFETDMIIREDVTKANNDKFNYDNSGFTLKIKKNSLSGGEYKIGILINNLDTKKAYFKLCEKTIVL